MLEQLTSEQLSEWQVYSRLEPFKEWKADYLNAKLCTLIINIAKSMWGKKGSGNKLSSIEDFLLQKQIDEAFSQLYDGTDEIKQQSIEDMKKELHSIFSFAKRSGKLKTKALVKSKQKPPKRYRGKSNV